MTLTPLLAAALAAQPAPPQTAAPQTVPPETGTFRYTTLSLETGVAKFRAICLEPLLDHQAIEQAVMAAGLEFRRDRNIIVADEWLWSSRYGSVYFRANSAMADGRQIQDCSVRFVIPRRMGQRALTGRIGRLLAPGRPRTDTALGPVWDFGGNYTDRVALDGFAPADDRFIELNRRHIYPGRAQETPR